MASIFPLFPQKRLILRLDTTNPRRGVYRIPYPMPTSQSPHHHFRHNVKYRNFPLISYDVKTGQTRLCNYSHFIDDRFKRNATKSYLFSARLHVIFLEFPLYGLVCLSVYCFYRNPLPHSGLSDGLGPGNLRNASRTRHNQATHHAPYEKTNKRTRPCGSPHYLFKY